MYNYIQTLTLKNRPKGSKKMIVTIANQKGGCGKTTTATALSSILADKGYKTLLIDADQQTNSSDTYKAKIEGVATLYDLIVEDEETTLQEAIQTTETGHIIAGDPLLREADTKLSKDLNGRFKLQEALECNNDYDFIIIDTAPSMGEVLYNCLIASDFVIIPVTADRYSLQGLAQLNETIKGIKKRFNDRLRIAGLLLVKFNSRTLLSKETREALEHIAQEMDTKLFKTAIRASTKAQEAQAKRTTLIKYAPNSTTAQDYKQFIDELLKEILNNGKE
jgi:chromosome partitioning protein